MKIGTVRTDRVEREGDTRRMAPQTELVLLRQVLVARLHRAAWVIRSSSQARTAFAEIAFIAVSVFLCLSVAAGSR